MQQRHAVPACVLRPPFIFWKVTDAGDAMMSAGLGASGLGFGFPVGRRRPFRFCPPSHGVMRAHGRQGVGM